MKNKLLLLFTIVICGTTFGQQPFYIEYNDWWISVGHKLIPVDNGYYLYTNHIIQDSHIQSCDLIRLNGEGDSVWTKSIDDSYGFSRLFAERDETGNLYLTTFCDTTEVIKTDSLGNIIRKSRYPYNLPKDMKRLQDGNLILFTNHGTSLAILKIDTSGNEIWNRVIPTPTNDSTITAIELTELTDGRICAVTETYRLYGNKATYFNLYSSTGDSLAKFKFFDNDFQQAIWSVMAANDHELYFTGVISDGYWKQRFIGKLDVNTGEKVWIRPVFPDALDLHMVIAGITDKVMVSGIIQMSALHPTQILTAAFSTEAELIWMTHHSNNYYSKVYNSTICEDGGFAVAGHVSGSQQGHRKCFFLRTDYQGFSSPLSIRQNEITQILPVFPNPADNVAYLFGTPDLLKVELLNSEGKILWTYTALPGLLDYIMIPLTELSHGIYIVRITTEKGVQSQKLIK